MRKSLLAFVFFGVLAPAAWAGTAYTTEPASAITGSSAQLNGTAASTNTPVTPFFAWGTTTAYGYHGAATPQNTNGRVSLQIENLSCGTTYHYRLYGAPGKSGTTVQGQDMTFTTASCPQKYVDVEAGLIADNAAAQTICPNACASAGGTWSGQWTNIVSPSVCGCWVPTNPS